MSSQENINEGSSEVPPKKKLKRLVKFNKSWKNTYSWLKQGQNEYTAICSVCRSVTFSISHGGENDIRRHMNTSSHKSYIAAAAQGNKIDQFFATSSSTNETKVIAAETTFCYHSCIHSHSYRSTGCASTLFRGMFMGSEAAKMYSCGKTKANAIVTKVLGPFSKTMILRDLEKCTYFSVMTDASNKGNIKTFPLLLRYFHQEKGLKTSLLCFYSLNSETAISIADSLKKQLLDSGLDLKHITAYCADNASVNFGKNNSVFVELKKVSEDLIPIGCNAHILHNTAKKACNILKIDIESVIIKIYNEFSSSSKKVAELKEFFEWTDTEWAELLKHVPTRWLTLLPAIERLILKFQPIKSYFMSKNSVPPILRSFFDEELGLAYLGLVSNVFLIFQEALTKLQSNGLLILEIFEIMDKVRNSLQERKNEQYFGNIARTQLQKCTDDVAIRRFRVDAERFFETAINYLEKWFDFANCKFKILRPLRLIEPPVFTQFETIITTFKIPDIDFDVLFEEICSLKGIFSEDAFKATGDCEQKWILFFKKFPEAKNLYRIISFIFSIPHANAPSERVFSLMQVSWRKERTNLSLKNLEAELMVKENYDLSCSEFQKMLSQPEPEGLEILKLAKSSNKYTTTTTDLNP